ncbi:MAG TPA: hypothetical protein DD671_13310, partial [Balneolaceae bacterium]|nr:hypothetical protein [Balneolaceae bacterium]
KLYIRDIYKPHSAGAVSALLLATGLLFFPWFTRGLLEQAALGAIVLVVFGLLLGGDYLRRVRKKLKKSTG